MCGFDFSQKKMSTTLQQRVCIKFCVENGFNGAQTLEMLEKCFGLVWNKIQPETFTRWQNG